MNTSVIIDSPARISSWRNATWSEYLECVKNLGEQERIFFNLDTIWIDMGNEGINHSRFNELFTLILFVWFSRQTDVKFDLLGGCVMEKPQTQSAAPDKVLYVGGDSPRCKSGEPCRVNLDLWRVPDLVAEIADTTLATDLDEKKQLYLALGIPEYWVIDVKGRQVLAFGLVDRKYEQCSESVALTGLPIELLEQTLEQMDNENGNAALWFAAQIQNLPTRSIDS